MTKINANHLFYALAGALIVLFILLRFFWLDISPPGFYLDEAGGASHILCFKETGENYFGESLPLYSKTFKALSLGTGRTSPTYFYSGLTWVSIFGSSPGSLRSMSAFYGLLTILALGFIAWKLMGTTLALWTLIAAVISPWSFHSARIAWDPPLAPAFLVLGFGAFILGRNSISAVLAGIFFALSMYSYAPFMVQISLLLFSLIFFHNKFESISYKRFAITILCIAITLLPLLLTFPAEISNRAEVVGVFGHGSGNPAANLTFLQRIDLFLLNVSMHFDPRYLFLSGEVNLRHTTGSFGIMSWLDAMSIMTTVVVGMLQICKAKFLKTVDQPKLFPVVLICIIGYISAVAASSLTWEALPHGLRSLGGWPFISLLTGSFIYYVVSTFPRTRWLFLAMAYVFSFFFLLYYFFYFPKISAQWFDRPVSSTALCYAKINDYPGWKEFVRKSRYPSLAANYFSMHYFKKHTPKISK